MWGGIWHIKRSMPTLHVQSSGQQKAKNAQSWPQLFWALTPKRALSCELPLWPKKIFPIPFVIIFEFITKIINSVNN
jgi:hypothetical protein